MVLRPEKQARAALNNFETWHSQKLAQCPNYLFPIANSTVAVARCVAPHSMTYFLIQVLQRLLHQFWATAQKDAGMPNCERQMPSVHHRSPVLLRLQISESCHERGDTSHEQATTPRQRDCACRSASSAISRFSHSGIKWRCSACQGSRGRLLADVCRKRHAALGLAGSVGRRHSRCTKIRPRQSTMVDSGSPAHSERPRGGIATLGWRQQDGQEELVPRVRSSRHI